MQFSEKYNNWKAEFIRMIQKYESMWDGHFEKIKVVKNGIVSITSDRPTRHSSPYCAGRKQWVLNKKNLFK